jgi:hypothetical protein
MTGQQMPGCPSGFLPDMGRQVSRSIVVRPGAGTPVGATTHRPGSAIGVTAPGPDGIIARLLGGAPTRDNAVDQDGQALARRREGPADAEITPRDVRDSDLPVFWAQMSDERLANLRLA